MTLYAIDLVDIMNEAINGLLENLIKYIHLGALDDGNITIYEIESSVQHILKELEKKAFATDLKFVIVDGDTPLGMYASMEDASLNMSYPALVDDAWRYNFREINITLPSTVDVAKLHSKVFNTVCGILIPVCLNADFNTTVIELNKVSPIEVWKADINLLFVNSKRKVIISPYEYCKKENLVVHYEMTPSRRSIIKTEAEAAVASVFN